MHVDTPHDAPTAGMERPLRWSLWINLAYAAVELAAGIMAGSIALISDAVHNLSDVPSMSISLLALRAEKRPADSLRTFGYRRSGVLAAFTNCIALLAVGGYVIWEAADRAFDPGPVATDIMIWVSIAGLVVNGGIAAMMLRGRRDLNLRTVLIHNAGDAASSLAILAGAIIIGQTGHTIVDPILGVLIGVGILWSSIGVLRETTHILLEGTPASLRIEQVAEAILRDDQVQEVHDVHIWSLGANHFALSCHVRVTEMTTSQGAQLLNRLVELLEREFHIGHTTIQIEPMINDAELQRLEKAPEDS